MKWPRAKRRAGIGWALGVLVAILFLFGVVWDVLYYGGILGAYTEVTALFGLTDYDSATLGFVMAFAAWWPFLVTINVIRWVWQQSNKPSGSF